MIEVVAAIIYFEKISFASRGGRENTSIPLTNMNFPGVRLSRVKIRFRL